MSRSIASKWQKAWHDARVFEKMTTAEDKRYILMMFPYPSGTLHAGHARNYVMGDVLARFHRAHGRSVLHPMGWDAFGLPAENAALQKGIHPAVWTRQNIAQMRDQLKSLGISYTWDAELATCDRDYYHQQQKIFIAFFEAGLAFRKASDVNWDPVEHTVLANEQVVDGRGWRSGALVEKKRLEQWFFRITNFSEDLLSEIDNLDEWPEAVRTMQRNWIGRSEGANVSFAWADSPEPPLQVFTTRPETLFGATFVALAAEHPWVQRHAKTVSGLPDFVHSCRQTATDAETLATLEKRGFFMGHHVQHPFQPERTIPVYVANFVLAEFGTGAIFGCPAHDQRDYDFAMKMHLPIVPVVFPEDQAPTLPWTEPHGVLADSDFLNGLSVMEARARVIDALEEQQKGERVVRYALRDWGVSRQRYWGCPIPMICCAACGWLPVPEQDLPVTLPEDVSFDTPGNPLERHATWKHVPCPRCAAPAERATDTLDTFVDSSWYFFRFCDSKNAAAPFDKKTVSEWLPVDHYIGGIEHAVLHLLYARFVSHALHKIGWSPVKEPFRRLFTQGMVCHETYENADGKWVNPKEAARLQAAGARVTVGPVIKMSKSKDNVVGLEDMAEEHGVDALRLFILSDSPPEKDFEWTDIGIRGCARFLRGLEELIEAVVALPERAAPENESEETQRALRAYAKATQDITRCIERLRLNTYVSGLRGLVRAVREAPEAFQKTGLALLAQLAAPVVPHLAEEIWERLGHAGFVHETPWPVADERWLQNETVELAFQINGKTRAILTVPADASEEDLLAHADVQKRLGEQAPRKIIFVAGKIFNCVV